MFDDIASFIGSIDIVVLGVIFAVGAFGCYGIGLTSSDAKPRGCLVEVFFPLVLSLMAGVKAYTVVNNIIIAILITIVALVVLRLIMFLGIQIAMTQHSRNEARLWEEQSKRLDYSPPSQSQPAPPLGGSPVQIQTQPQQAGCPSPSSPQPLEASAHGNIQPHSTSSTEWVQHFSALHNFAAYFPKAPIVNSEQFQQEGYSVPITTYTYKAYTYDEKVGVQVQAAEPPRGSVIDTRSYLAANLTNLVNATNGILRNADNSIEFLGNPATSAVIEMLSGGQVWVMHALSFIKDNNQYLLVATGRSQDSQAVRQAFNMLTRSFRFN
jgi:hypothetical protein